MTPETRYAKRDGLHLAYQVSGEGPPILSVHSYGSHQDVQWDEPRFAHYLRRLASIGRLITFDKRGTGASDRFEREPTLEERVEDIHIVLDEVGADRATVYATTGGCAPAILFAATSPERVERLVLYCPHARRTLAPDYPWGVPADRLDSLLGAIEQRDAWGRGVSVRMMAPSVADDERFVRWLQRYERAIASPRSARDIWTFDFRHDVRDILPSVAAPTLVLVRTGLPESDVGGARYVADRIPHAELVELPGVDEYVWVGDSDAVVDAIETFISGAPPSPSAQRVLSTVLFTDLVDSTRRAAELGDRRWRALLDSHDALVRQELDTFDGIEVKHTGDGFCARFDGPARAVRCALAIRDSLAALGLESRAGVHTGEIELRDTDVAGVAVHVAARVAGVAEGGEVLTTSTVCDLTFGAGLAFADRCEHDLKGLDGRWHLLAAEEAARD